MTDPGAPQSFRDKCRDYLALNVIIPLFLIACPVVFLMYVWVIPEIADRIAFWDTKGGIVPAEPHKTPTKAAPFAFRGTYGTPFTHKGHYIITPVADYDIEARVLHTRRYYSHANAADLIPFDIALGWQLMSDPYALRHYFIFHHSNSGGRLLWVIPRVSYEDMPADYLDEPVSGLHFSNNHIIPASDAVFDTLNHMSAGDHVRLQGYLVNIASSTNPNWYWNTTKYARGDTGKNFYWGEAGEPTCDTMFVTEATVY